MDDVGQDLELALLVAPIPGDAPAGTDLRQDYSPQSFYYRLRDARAEARELERRADHDPAAEAAPPQQWRLVRELASKALSERTKDLEIAVWLTEALVRQQGLIGIAAGARLIAELADAFWDNGLYPLPDEEGIATRVAPITGLNGQGGDGTLMQPLRKLVLFSMPDGRPISFWQYAQSEELEAIADETRRKQRLDANVVRFDDLSRAANGAGAAHFAALRSEVQAALVAWAVMDERLMARAGADAPPTTRIRDLLLSILEIAKRYAPPESTSSGAVASDVAAVAATSESAPDGGGQAVGSQVVTRDSMLRELERIAEYFRRTEPHSPLAYTLQEAVRRGRLTWPELLEEVVPDGNVRGAILAALGIRPPSA